MKKIIITSVLLCLTANVNAEYLCTYKAKLSKKDKYNSSGKSLNKSVSKKSVAAIIRQDRANFYVFNKRDAQDEKDCVFYNKKDRATMERLLRNGSIPRYAIKRIVYGSPTIEVDIYSSHVAISLLDEQESFVR